MILIINSLIDVWLLMISVNKLYYFYWNIFLYVYLSSEGLFNICTEIDKLFFLISTKSLKYIK